MIRGLYIAAEGMLARQTAQDVLASNLANANTTGFKADRVVFQSALEQAIYRVQGTTPVLIGSLSGGSLSSDTFSDLSPGSIETTGNPLDVAIIGDGFFAIQTPNGVRYTRNGAFQQNAQGMLVTRQGFPVLGNSGPIQVPAGTRVTFGRDGSVLVDGTPVDRLQIVSGNLSKRPSGFFTSSPTPVATPTLQPGALESSNVSIVREMINMIEVMRAYEANQKVVHAQDDALGRAVNELARI